VSQDQGSFDLLKRIIENFEIDGAVTKYHISEARDLIQKRERSSAASQ